MRERGTDVRKECVRVRVRERERKRERERERETDVREDFLDFFLF